MPLYPAKKFVAFIRDKYGDGIVADLYKVKKNCDYSLTWLSKRHGFSRERARQIYKRFFRVPYTKAKAQHIETRKKKRTIIKNRRRELYFDPHVKLKHCKNKDSNVYKGTTTEVVALEICQSLGFTFTTKNATKKIDLIINGLYCEVKSSFKSFPPHKSNRYKYFHCNFRAGQREKADFLLWYIGPTNKFYVIPKVAFAPTSFYIPDTSNPHRYSEFEGAWHLLKREGSLNETI